MSRNCMSRNVLRQTRACATALIVLTLSSGVGCGGRDPELRTTV